ncbi:MAG TPA: hypothetical protein VJ124_19080 [Pyrinomonadaceae bacterium]|nr:hypothetical protein [Pyrinomonadaceae bacterium]
MASEHYLPDQFQELNSFSERWALATERERNDRRRSSTMEEIQKFYDAILPRMDEIINYLNQYPLDGLPVDARRLFYLALSFMEISPSVELFREPDETGAFEATRFKIIEPGLA